MPDALLAHSLFRPGLAVLCGAVALWLLWRIAQVSLGLRAARHLVNRMKARQLLPASARVPSLGVFLLWRPLRETLEAAIAQHAGVREEREKLRELAGAFTSRDGVESLLHRREADAPGTRRPVTILFADIRGFTAMCEHLQPDTVVRLLNNHLAQMTEAIRGRSGEVNKFVGDGILAVFYPSKGEGQWNDPQRACLAALEMQAAFHDIADSWKYYLPDGVSVGLGIGIHTGEVVEGNMGSAHKLEFAVIGDTVNTASRLCALAPAGAVRLSYDTYAKLSGTFAANELEPVSLKGKALPVAVYSLVGLTVPRPPKAGR